MGEEKYANVFPVLRPVFEEKEALMTEQPNITIYEMHDGKMLYLLTQHALFKCTQHHPFLLCKCRSDGVTNLDHVCELLTHEEQHVSYK
eukprot:scaffold138900_cov52-Attheya_sp.AAC.5